MRQIERDMISAIKLGKCWRKANTEVYTNDNNCSLVYLHGNHIATVMYNKVSIFDGGYQSNTTKSRLNAILKGLCDGYTCSVYQFAGEWFITDDKLIHQFENGYTFARV
jgi:hypothetical protein